MFRLLLIVVLQVSFLNLIASEDSIADNLIIRHKLILGVESNIKFISSDLNFQKQGFDLGLNLNYYTNNIVYLGLFYNQMNDVWNTSDKTFLLDNNTVNISTANFNNFGVLAGYRMLESKRFIIMPELRIGYGGLAFKSINSETIKKVDILTFDPRLNFGYKFNNTTILGFSASYFIPFYQNNEVDIFYNYNLKNASLGVYLKIPLLKIKTQKKNGVQGSDFKQDLSQTDVINPDKESIDTSIFNGKITNEKTQGYNRSTENNNDSFRNDATKSESIDNEQDKTSNFKEKITRKSKSSEDSRRIYNLVVASFKSYKKANRFVAIHNKKANNKYTILYNSDINRHRVIFNINASKSEALMILNNTRKKFPGTWILNKE